MRTGRVQIQLLDSDTVLKSAEWESHGRGAEQGRFDLLAVWLPINIYSQQDTGLNGQHEDLNNSIILAPPPDLQGRWVYLCECYCGDSIEAANRPALAPMGRYLCRPLGR